MSGINLAARPRSTGSVWEAIRQLERQIAYIRSARALSLRSMLAGIVDGADSIASAALAAAVLAQSRADEAWGHADARALVRGGSTSGTTDAAGEFTVAHPLGKIPLLASAQVLGSPNLSCAPVSSTSSSSTFLLVDRTTGAVPTTAFTAQWAVVA